MADHRKHMTENLAHEPVIALRGFCDVETAQKKAHTVCQADQIGKH
jgi:hypothetical protein